MRKIMKQLLSIYFVLFLAANLFAAAPTLTPEMKAKCAVNNRPLPKIPGGQAARRAMTPPGFAKAFFEANP